MPKISQDRIELDYLVEQEPRQGGLASQRRH